MTTRADIVTEARRWLGTPFHHQGRQRGVGVDCAGLVVMTARSFGLESGYKDPLNYAPEPHDGLMRQVLDAHMDRIEPGQRRLADVVWLAFARDPHHLGILTEDGMILHAWNHGPNPRVVEHGLRGPFLDALRRVYRFRGLED